MLMSKDMMMLCAKILCRRGSVADWLTWEVAAKEEGERGEAGMAVVARAVAVAVDCSKS